MLILAEPNKKRGNDKRKKNNGNTVFASDDTSYWLQGAKVIGDDGHVYGHAETIRDALCLVLAKYGGLKGNSTKQTKPVKAVRQW